MPDSTTFSTRSNAKRSAEKAIHDGTAPSIDYKLHTREDGRIEIQWKPGITPAQADVIDVSIATESLAAIERGKERLISGDELEQRLDAATTKPVVEAEEEAQADEPPARGLTLTEFMHTPEAAANRATWDEMLTKAEVDGWPDTEAIDETDEEPDENEDNGFGPDPWPPGARVRVALGKRRTRLGTVDYQTDHTHWRVFLDGGVPVSNLYSGDQLSAPGDDVPAAASAKKERGPLATHAGRPSKAAELDAAAARGVMPEKPICTSEANKAQYQPRFDHLAERAAAGDWEAVRKYEVKGINSYAKMVKQYRDRLLAAHEASQKEEAA